MYQVYEIRGIVESLSNMHIGDNGDFSVIGGIDNPIVKNPITNHPYIPGSTFKGKGRSLLARKYNETRLVKNPDCDDRRIVMLFGGSKKINGSIPQARLSFNDMKLINAKELREMEKSPVIAITKNSINRLSGVANPRQMECSIEGAKYEMCLHYTVYDEEEVYYDFELIREMFSLLQIDGIGGSVSRGFGRIKIYDIEVECIDGEDSLNEEKLKEILGE